MVARAKGKTKESFDSRSAWEFSARYVSVETHARLFDVEREVKLNANQHGTNEDKNNIVSPSLCTIVMIQASNGAYFDVSMCSSKHACIPGERRSSMMYRCAPLFPSTSHIQALKTIPACAMNLPPHRSLARSNLESNYVLFTSRTVSLLGRQKVEN